MVVGCSPVLFRFILVTHVLTRVHMCGVQVLRHAGDTTAGQIVAQLLQKESVLMTRTRHTCDPDLAAAALDVARAAVLSSR